MFVVLRRALVNLSLSGALFFRSLPFLSPLCSPLYFSLMGQEKQESFIEDAFMRHLMYCTALKPVSLCDCIGQCTVKEGFVDYQ